MVLDEQIYDTANVTKYELQNLDDEYVGVHCIIFLQPFYIFEIYHNSMVKKNELNSFYMLGFVLGVR